MRSRLVSSMTFALLALAPASALADGLRLLSGGPIKKPARDAALAAVRTAQADMAPCWRGTPPAEVLVQLSIGPAGEVVSSTAKTGGAPAQCAAGLLAVASFPAGERWSGVVAIPASPSSSGPSSPSSGGGGGGNPGLESEITRQLAEHRDQLSGCQLADPSASGQLAVTLAISPAGAIAPTVASSTVSKPIEGCVTGALRRVSLALSERRAVRYQFSLSFSGEAQHTAPRPSQAQPSEPTAGPSLKVGSSLSAAQIDTVLAAHKAELLRCGKAARGDVTVGFTVRPDGSVKNVSIKSSTTGDAKVDACVVAQTQALHFPTSGGESRATYPLQFRK